MCEICSKLTVKTPERRRSGVFIVNFDHISYIFLVFLLLTLNNIRWVNITDSMIISLKISKYKELYPEFGSSYWKEVFLTRFLPSNWFLFRWSYSMQTNAFVIIHPVRTNDFPEEQNLAVHSFSKIAKFSVKLIFLTP